MTNCSSNKDAANEEQPLTQYVNPYIGTGDHGHVFLGANVPFGFVQLGPSQEVKGWDWCSGYHYSDTALVGFSHTHLSGTGIGDLGDVTFLPVTDRSQSQSAFSHDRETVRPGYYAVTLDGSGVFAELTATPRTGMHRYTYPEGTDTAFVKIDMNYGIGWDKMTGSGISIDNDSTISGCRYSTGWAKDQKIYFTASFSKPLSAYDIDSIGGWIAFAPDGAPLLIKVGISAVSADNALQNLLAENSGWDFDLIAGNADKAWNSKLNKVRIDTDNDSDRQVFYTAMYHSMFSPSVFNDVNGEYRGADGQIHNTGNVFTNYTIFSLWDTYRAAHPLSTIIHPEMQKDLGNTFLNIYAQQGKLPVWHLAGNETDCMVGNPGIPVLADIVLKGYNIDAKAALEAMKASALLDERELDLVKEYGYIPYDKAKEPETVAKGLEYALADASIAKVAEKLGNTEDVTLFGKRGQAYALYFDSISGFMRARDSKGKFREPLNPFFNEHRMNDYTEGNGWQYIWLVPQDVHGLVGLFGSEERFVQKLDSLFVAEGYMGDNASPDITGLIGQYAHGNEPSHHVIYLYNYVGQPWKTADKARQIMTTLYHAAPEGLCGNEDVGQMSAWYILSSMGLYQVEPAGGRYVFGSPLFKSASIDVGGGKRFVIKAENNSAENKYIKSARFNGQPYTRSYIDFADITAGGTLEFEMGSEPSATFGVETADRP